MFSSNWTASTTRRGGWLIFDAIIVAVSIVVGLYVSAEMVGSSLNLKLTPVKTLVIFFIICCWLVAVSADSRKAFRRWPSFRDDLSRLVAAAALSTISLFLVFYTIPNKSFQASLHEALWPSLAVLVSLSIVRGFEHLVIRWRCEETTVLFVEIDSRWYDSLAEIRASLVDDWRMSIVALQHRLEKSIALPAEVEIWDEARFKRWINRDIGKRRKCLVVLGENQPKTRLHEDLIRKIYGTPIPTTNMVDFYEEVLEKTPLFEEVTSWHSSICLPQPSRIDLAMKRVMEIAVSLPLLVLSLPLLLVFGIIIRLESKGPAIFKQTRVGFRGKDFTCYKLRTMEVHEYESQPVTKDYRHPFQERYVTRFGAFLRRTALDEIPQLFNVLKGDMSLIGPRPERRKIVERHEKYLPFYAVQNSIKPGLSGWAQLHNGQDIDGASIFEKTRYNIYYAKYFSFWLDLLIYIRTFSKLIVGKKPQTPYVAATGLDEKPQSADDASAAKTVDQRHAA